MTEQEIIDRLVATWKTVEVGVFPGGFVTFVAYDSSYLDGETVWIFDQAIADNRAAFTGTDVQWLQLQSFSFDLTNKIAVAREKRSLK